MAGQVKECTYKNATVRIHFPDRTKEEQTEIIKRATEKFLKKVEAENRKRRRENGK